MSFVRTKKYMFSQALFGVKWRSVLSYLTGGSLREKALDDRREWRNVLSHLTAQQVTWRSSGVAECLSHWTAREGTWRSSGVAE